MRLIWQDGLVALALCMNMGAAMSTNFILGTVENMAASATALEMNPVMRWALDVEYAQFVLMAAAYGLLLAVYWYSRRFMLDGKVPEFYLNAMVFVVFYTFSRDFLGDLAIVARIMGVG